MNKRVDDVDYMDEKDKPEDFPANNREARLLQIYELLTQIPKNPDYKVREVLSALCIETDLNEKNSLGVMRFTTYEVTLINSIYYLASVMHAEFIKVYLYREIIAIERQFRMWNNMKKKFGFPEDDEQETVGSLVPMLKIFYVVYSNFKTNRSRTFVDEIISTYYIFVQSTTDEEMINERTRNLISMILDLSYVESYKTFPVLKFDRSELKKLFDFIASVLKRTNQNISKRPLLGVMCIMISNYVFKSRNGYNNENLYKCLSNDTLEKALDNYEIWMNETSNLNDKREGKFIIDLFTNKNWIDLEWAKKARLNQRMSYVSSFVKGFPSDKIKTRYGGNLLGYKNDKIAATIAPFVVVKGQGLSLGHVVVYDIIYSRKEAKEELNFLFSIIDGFNVNDDEKTEFLEAILPYWKYSFKDSRWKEENERRYEILFFESYNYLETSVADNFFKIKTTLLNYPDIAIVREHKSRLIDRRMNKLGFISNKEYQFCKDCLSSDFDNSRALSCSVCGSTSVKLMNKRD